MRLLLQQLQQQKALFDHLPFVVAASNSAAALLLLLCSALLCSDDNKVFVLSRKALLLRLLPIKGCALAAHFQLDSERGSGNSKKEKKEQRNYKPSLDGKECVCVYVCAKETSSE